MNYRKVEEVYPITITTYPNGDKSMKYITDYNLDKYTPKIRLDSLWSHLAGQTRYIEGNYAHDIERWLNNQPVID